MAMSWFMTVQEAGERSPVKHLSGITFDLTPRWFGDEPPPNPNRFDTLQRCPDVVEIRRPDGTRMSAEPHLVTYHLNFSYELRDERNAGGHIRNPWGRLIVLKGVSVEEVPPGSEIWGEVTDD